MAAACELTEAVHDGSSENPALTETEIVAQAITELQQISGPVTVQEEPSSSAVAPVSETGTSTDANSLINCYFRNEDAELIGDPTNTNVTEADLADEATQVIYYIENGVVSRTEKVLVDSSVQANDYEIERRSGRLPARRRVIPFKFRDYKNTSNDEDSDSDYEPEVKTKIRRITKEKITDTAIIGQHKKPGRPRKTPLPESAIAVPAASSEDTTQNEPKAINITVVKEENIETVPKNAEEITEEENDVLYLPLRKNRGRPRGPDWRKDYQCPQCGKIFSQRGNMKSHMRTHTDERPYPCQEEGCDKTFRSAESLRRHILSHKGIKPFECDICHNKFSSNIGLREHKSRHTDSKPHKCPHCPKYFRQVSCLRRHVITHSTDKPFLCQVCMQRFSQMAYLKSHMKVHTGEKPFQCDICQKRFAHQSDVKRHKITHTGEKRYACEICQAKFSDPSSKRRHEKEHSKKKAYICQLCDETFRRSGQLKAHLANKHMLAVKIEMGKGPGTGSLMFNLQNDSSALSDSVSSNQRIIQLIKSLSTKTSLSNADTEEINLSCGSNQSENQTQSVAMTSDQVSQISQLQQAEEAGLIESTGQVPIELQGIEIQEEEEGGQTFIAITDLAESLSKSSAADGSGVYQYQIIQEINEDGNTHQVLIPYDQNTETETSEVIQETETSVIIQETVDENANIDQPEEESNAVAESKVPENTTEMDGLVENGAISEIENSETAEAVATVDKSESQDPVSPDQETDAPKTIVFDYVTHPDYSSQDYYNWLSNFTELCKVVPMPLDVSLFQKISQVHKTLSDVMATPSGVVADKENFRVLMNITKELSTIINEHLLFVLENMTPEEKSKAET